MMETVRGKLWFVGIVVACAIVAFLMVDLYDRGYRFTGLRILFPAHLSVEVPEGATLLLDQTEVPVDASPVRIRTVSGTHTLSATKEGYWPWEKEVEVESGATARFAPFLIQKTTVGTVVEKKDARFAAANTAFADSVLPTEESPLLSSDATTRLFIRDNAVLATWVGSTPAPAYFCERGVCDGELEVLSFDAEIRSLAFLPGRNDVILLAAQNGVFALELDTRGIQNFQPLYKGQRPVFVILDETLFLKDAGSMFTVEVR